MEWDLQSKWNGRGFILQEWHLNVKLKAQDGNDEQKVLEPNKPLVQLTTFPFSSWNSTLHILHGSEKQVAFGYAGHRANWHMCRHSKNGCPLGQAEIFKQNISDNIKVFGSHFPYTAWGQSGQYILRRQKDPTCSLEEPCSCSVGFALTAYLLNQPYRGIFAS